MGKELQNYLVLGIMKEKQEEMVFYGSTGSGTGKGIIVRDGYPI